VSEAPAGQELSRRRLLVAGGSGAALAVAAGLNGAATAPAATTGGGLINVKDHGAQGNGSADDTAAINAAIAALTPNRGLYFPSGIYRITSAPRAIDKNDVTIIGDGPGATVIRYPSTAGSNGTFFTIGTDSITANRVNIEGLRLQCLNASPDAANPAFLIKNAADVRIDQIHVNDVSALCKCGTDTVTVNRIWFRNVIGDYNAAQGGKVVWLHNVRGFRAVDVQVTGTGVPAGTGYSVYAVPVSSGGFLDTAYFTRCSIWTRDQAHGVYLDATQGKIVHFFFNECVFDYCAADAFKIHSSGKEVRNILVRGTLLGAQNVAGSNCVDISHSGASSTTDPLTGVSFEDCLMAYRGGKAAGVSGSTIRDLLFDGNRVQDSTLTAKSAAFSFASGNWSAIGNRFVRYAGGGNTDHAIETTEDVDGFLAVANRAQDLNKPDFFKHFPYARPSGNRIVQDNTNLTTII
jgi:hypothetical protein